MHQDLEEIRINSHTTEEDSLSSAPPLSIHSQLNGFSGIFVFTLSTTHTHTAQTAMDTSGKEKEAMQLMAEADKKVKSSGSFLGGMFG